MSAYICSRSRNHMVLMYALDLALMTNTIARWIVINRSQRRLLCIACCVGAEISSWTNSTKSALSTSWCIPSRKRHSRLLWELCMHLRDFHTFLDSRLKLLLVFIHAEIRSRLQFTDKFFQSVPPLCQGSRSAVPLLMRSGKYVCDCAEQFQGLIKQG